MQESPYDQDADIPPSLRQMFIQSSDSLRTSNDVPTNNISIPRPQGWNDKPPLLAGPRGQPESTNLLKGMIRRGVPSELRCAVWLSNVVQAVYPHQTPDYWFQYRTLAKVRALDAAYDTLIQNLAAQASSSSNDEVDAYWQAAPTPTFGQSPVLEMPGTNDAGRLAIKRVSIALDHIVGLQAAPQLPTLVQLALGCMSESYAFCAVREMTHHARFYFAASRHEYCALGRAFGHVLRRLHGQTAEYFDDRDVLLMDQSLYHIFQNFFVGILPLPYVQRIFDIYTLEGYKVLFRFGVALLVLAKREAAEQLVLISNAQDFWAFCTTWTHDPRFNFEFLVRKAYGLHAAAARRAKPIRFPNRSVLQRMIKLEEERLREEAPDDDFEYANGSGTASSSKRQNLRTARPLGLVEQQPRPAETHLNRETVKPVLAVSLEARTNLANWLPLAMQLTNLNLLYSTNYHGRSLERFYTHTQRAKHTFVLCEVLKNDAEAKTVIGMYASQAWHPSTKVYGDGECFLFRLEPNPACFHWSPVTKRTGKKNGNNGDENDSIDFNNETALLEQFMVSTRTYLSMGGNDDGSCGLRLNEDLTIGESSPAVGFGNDALHQAKSSVFQVGLVEAYGFCRQIDGGAA